MSPATAELKIKINLEPLLQAIAEMNQIISRAIPPLVKTGVMMEEALDEALRERIGGIPRRPARFLIVTTQDGGTRLVVR